MNLPHLLIRIEGLVVFVVTAITYSVLGGRLLWFLVFFLVPDISFLGYLAGSRTGATAYNAFHTTLVPFLLMAIGLLGNSLFLILGSLIWFAHIGIDRALGFGLKYPGKSKKTHLQRL